MSSISRRQLAQYAADQLLDGAPVKTVTRQLAAVLVQTHRKHEAQMLLTDISWELERRGKLAQTTITSATPLTDKLRRELTLLIKKAAQVDKVNLEENIDKTVIGGTRIETAIHSWDKTIARELRDIQEAV